MPLYSFIWSAGRVTLTKSPLMLSLKLHGALTENHVLYPLITSNNNKTRGGNNINSTNTSNNRIINDNTSTSTGTCKNRLCLSLSSLFLSNSLPLSLSLSLSLSLCSFISLSIYLSMYLSAEMREELDAGDGEGSLKLPRGIKIMQY